MYIILTFYHFLNPKIIYFISENRIFYVFFNGIKVILFVRTCFPKLMNKYVK